MCRTYVCHDLRTDQLAGPAQAQSAPLDRAPSAIVRASASVELLRE
ncbi:hypothetical protein BraRD5C2_67520 [Bradyrhizobium sp. RD5-C2]|nr:hypothetical protein BraRD5C2_67520 [Bradyrhizobium sp. RD5-C2]